MEGDYGGWMWGLMDLERKYSILEALEMSLNMRYDEIGLCAKLRSDYFKINPQTQVGYKNVTKINRVIAPY